jgi:hypothetical protein
MRCGHLSSGEAAVVGGDDLFGTHPPAEWALTGEKVRTLSKKDKLPFVFLPESPQ